MTSQDSFMVINAAMRIQLGIGRSWNGDQGMQGVSPSESCSGKARPCLEEVSASPAPTPSLTAALPASGSLL